MMSDHQKQNDVWLWVLFAAAVAIGLLAGVQ